MILLSPKLLNKQEQKHLRRLQVRVNAISQGSARYKVAEALWRNRKNKEDNKRIWEAIERKLQQGSPNPGICQYCGFDRNAATEHFFPKKNFPEYTFQWNNYLRICHRCNSVYKGDKFAVFNPKGSATVYKLPVTRGTYPVPPTKDAVLINPRIDNPQDFLMLDISTGIFLPVPGSNSRDQARANYTIELLHLNIDDDLLRYRHKTLGAYLDKLDLYIKVKQASNFSSLLSTLSFSYQAIVVQTTPFTQEQQRLLKKIKKDIQDDFFTVTWREIIAQRHLIPRINDLFIAAPEAISW